MKKEHTVTEKEDFRVPSTPNNSLKNRIRFEMK